MWDLYEALLCGIQDGDTIKKICTGEIWTLVETERNLAGIAMTTEGVSRRPELTGMPEGKSIREMAKAIKSWNFPEASAAMAAINAWYNTEQRIKELNCEEPYEHYCTHGLNLAGKTIGVVGHLKMPEEALKEAKKVYILERNPQPGDYPDSACEYLLPECDVVLITGSALINKTLPRLLELCKNAYTILTGPTVPLCPALLEHGIDRIAGMVLVDLEAACEHVEKNFFSKIYTYGKTFLLERGRT